MEVATLNNVAAMQTVMKESWLTELAPFINSDKFSAIMGRIRKEKAGGKQIYPATDFVFRALNLCPPDKVRVVMAAQDPYHQPGTADGLAFSCGLTRRAQPSLAHIHSEIRRTVKDYTNPQPFDLQYLAKQGILLINASLTVEVAKPNSHEGLWDPFMDYLFHDVINKQPQKIIYALLGKNAQRFTRYARLGDYILTAVHPAAAAYSGGQWNCNNIFNHINTYLVAEGHEEIKW